MKQNWIYKKLGDCFPYIKNGANIKQEKNAKGYPITRIETLAGGAFNRDRMGYANIYELSKYADYLLSSRDLLMSHINSKAYIGRTVEYVAKDENEHIIHGMNLLRIKSNNEVIDSSFFVYYTHCHAFTSSIAKIRKDAVNQSSFSISDLKNIPIPVPPLADQSRIVAELDLLQSIIDKQKAQLKEYDTLAQSIFYDMFGDPVDNEKGWEMKKLGQVCSVVKGLVNPNDEPYCNYPHIGGANIQSNTGVFIDVKLAKDENLISGKYLFDETMILYSKIRPNLNKVALPTFKGICSADMYPIIINPKYVNKYYVKNTLTQKTFLEYAVSHSGRANIPKINREDLLAYEFPIPPLPLQQKFAEKIEAIEQQKTRISQSIAEAQKLFDYTMDKYFG